MTTHMTAIHKTKRGLKLPLNGAPGQRIDDGAGVTQVAVIAADYPDIRPKMAIQEGDAVKRGTILFEDRKNKGIRFTSPGAGTVAAIHRGARRALLSVIIALDESETASHGASSCETFDKYTGKSPEILTSTEVKDLLTESGLFTAIRRRPFDKIPSPKETPRSLFIMAAGAHPHSPNPTAVLRDMETDWRAGVVAINRLVGDVGVHVIIGAEGETPVPDMDGISVHRFEGPYPFGTAGSAIHTIAPVNRDRTAWYIDCQDVAAIGHLVLTGEPMVERVVSLAGPGVRESRLIRTRVGAPISALVDGALRDGDHRIISGSVLGGRASDNGALDFIGPYHDQISVIENKEERRLLGWLAPGADRFSVSRLFFSKLLPQSSTRFTTDVNGGERVMVPIGLFEKVWPFELLVTPLLRALLAEDDETAEALGCLELSEEDVAACSFVCPSKINYGKALRAALDRIEEQG